MLTAVDGVPHACMHARYTFHCKAPACQCTCSARCGMYLAVNRHKHTAQLSQAGHDSHMGHTCNITGFMQTRTTCSTTLHHAIGWHASVTLWVPQLHPAVRTHRRRACPSSSVALLNTLPHCKDILCISEPDYRVRLDSPSRPRSCTRGAAPPAAQGHHQAVT